MRLEHTENEIFSIYRVENGLEDTVGDNHAHPVSIQGITARYFNSSRRSTDDMRHMRLRACGAPRTSCFPSFFRVGSYFIFM
jgi:hypothetical protein